MFKKLVEVYIMSKWIDKEVFEDFQKEKIEEKDNEGSQNRSAKLWPTPEKGSIENPKVYEGRFVPDPKGKFYQRYYYHMWQAGDESWIFILCPKTHDFKTYCPFCSVTSKLYAGGTKSDKAQGYNIKRKEKFVGNWFVVKDPRDQDKEDDNKSAGKLKLYEFPGKVEQKLKKEITDKSEGYGLSIFDPSDEGRNFIIRVLSTKKDDRGKQWPDYSNSSFARSRSAIADSDEGIQAILDLATDIEEYISDMTISDSKMVEILKNEFLWDMVADEAINNGYEDDGSRPKEAKKEEPEKKEEPDKDEEKEKEDLPPWDEDEKKEEPEEKKEEPEEKPEEKKEEPEKKADSASADDEALLKELEDM
jgi:hypothetical protein